MSEEEWRPIPGYEGMYEVSSHGRVRSLPRYRVRSHRILKPRRGDAYSLYALFKDGMGSELKIHRLVATAFIRPPRPGELCRHLDGDPTNNRPENLAWGSYSDNAIDTVLHGANFQANKTQCDNGHEFDNENTKTVLEATGRYRRVCRACQRQWQREYRMRKAAAMAQLRIKERAA